jgi:hypothetical protein
VQQHAPQAGQCVPSNSHIVHDRTHDPGWFGPLGAGTRFWQHRSQNVSRQMSHFRLTLRPNGCSQSWQTVLRCPEETGSSASPAPTSLANFWSNVAIAGKGSNTATDGVSWIGLGRAAVPVVACCSVWHGDSARQTKSPTKSCARQEQQQDTRPCHSTQ